MKWSGNLLLCGSLAMASLSAYAQADLAKKKNCTACHAVATNLVGPSFKSIAAKYAGQVGAADMLALKIVAGGAGAWGSISMPPNPQVSPEEARQLATWALSQR